MRSIRPKSAANIAARSHSKGLVAPRFQKKSKSGIKTPAEDLKMIQQRLKTATADYEIQIGKGKSS